MNPSSRLRAALVVAAFLAACAGKSSDPPPANANPSLPCLATLDAFCCSDAAPKPCIGDFATASRCGSWPGGTQVRVYANACHGMTAVRVESSWSTFYIYDGSGALLAIADNAASSIDPRDTTIECGAGAPSFTVPAECGDGWLSTTGAQGCAGGASASASYCGAR